MNKKNVSVACENKPRPGEEYVMECTLTVRNGTRTAEFRGFATKEVVETALEIFRGVITNEHCPNCGARVVE